MREHEFRNLKGKALEELFQIAKCYGTGDGIGKDETAAVKWYRMAAEHGCAAMRCLSLADAIHLVLD